MEWAARHSSARISIAVDDLSAPLRDDRALIGGQFVGVCLIVRVFGEVLSQPWPVPLEAAQSQILVQSAHLPLGVADQIFIAQLVLA